MSDISGTNDVTNINETEYFKQKYFKYVKKCDELTIQIGGNKDVLKKLGAIKKNLDTKGYSYWFDTDGKLLASGKTQAESKKKLISKIAKNIDDYIEKEIVDVTLNIMSSHLDDNDKQGCLEIDIKVLTIKRLGKKVILNERNEKNSYLRFYYRSDDINNFKKSHAKTLAIKLLNNEIKKTNPFKFYHYEDFEDILDSDK
jgi:hypothetical protein